MNKMANSRHIPQIQIVCHQFFIYTEAENFITDLELHTKGLQWIDKDTDSAATYL